MILFRNHNFCHVTRPGCMALRFKAFRFKWTLNPSFKICHSSWRFYQIRVRKILPFGMKNLGWLHTSCLWATDWKFTLCCAGEPLVQWQGIAPGSRHTGRLRDSQALLGGAGTSGVWWSAAPQSCPGTTHAKPPPHTAATPAGVQETQVHQSQSATFLVTSSQSLQRS